MYFSTLLRSFLVTAVICCIVSVDGALAQEEIDLSKSASSDGSVEISNISGSIRVIGWDRDEVKVTGTLGKGVERLDFDVDGRETEIEVVYPKFGRNVKSSHLEIHVPEKSLVAVETVSASIDVSKVQGNVQLESVSGDVTVTGEPSDLEAQSVSGKVRISVSTMEVEIESVSGKIELEGTIQEIGAATVSGGIEIEVSGSRRLEVESVSGSIHFIGDLAKNGDYNFDAFSGTTILELPSNVNADFEIDTFSGSIENTFANEKSSGSKSFTIGSGGADVTIDTFSGFVKIVKK